jgi:hypothetical protein
MANLNFNSEGVERTGTYEPVPAGDYQAMITESTMRHPKDGYGNQDTSLPAYLELKIVIIDGEQKGRQLTDRLNLNNPNEMTRKIAKGTLAAILDACGMTTVNDSSELHNKPLVVKVTVKPGDGQYGPGNDVKGYKKYSPSTVTMPASFGQQATPAVAKPWG